MSVSHQPTLRLNGVIQRPSSLHRAGSRQRGSSLAQRCSSTGARRLSSDKSTPRLCSRPLPVLEARLRLAAAFPPSPALPPRPPPPPPPQSLTCRRVPHPPSEPWTSAPPTALLCLLQPLLPLTSPPARDPPAQQLARRLRHRSGRAGGGRPGRRSTCTTPPHGPWQDRGQAVAIQKGAATFNGAFKGGYTLQWSIQRGLHQRGLPDSIAAWSLARAADGSSPHSMRGASESFAARSLAGLSRQEQP
jgi:hypothetical protein